MYILDRLQRYMNRNDLSQRKVAEKILIDRAMLNKLFKGVKKPTENHIKKITAYLDLVDPIQEGQ